MLLISEVFMTQTTLKILYFMSYHHMRNNLIGINDIQPVDSIFVFANYCHVAKESKKHTFMLEHES